MPISFNIDRNRDLTILIFSGEVTLTEFINTLHTYIDNKPTTYEIYDLRDLSGDRFSADEIKELARFLSKSVPKRPSGGKTAVIVDRDIDFGLSRMISMMMDQLVQYQIEVFRSVDDAYAWLEKGGGPHRLDSLRGRISYEPRAF